VLEGLNPSQIEGRLRNAAVDFLQQRLIVPKIFLEAAWPTYNRVDVLAVDRAGAGDIHVVEVNSTINSIYEAVARLLPLPAHYKYVVTIETVNLHPIDESRLYAIDGMGRVGIIVVAERPADKSLQSRLAIAPERFRLEGKYWKEVDTFLASAAPDVEIRDR